MGGSEAIAEAIKDLGLTGALTYLVKKGIDLSEEGFEKVREIIREKYQERKYAFVPNKDEASQLKKLSNHPHYNEIQLLVPGYRHIDLIRTGLLIDIYQRKESEDYSERINEIKGEIVDRPNGSHLIKVANLPTTKFFSVVLSHLRNLKVEKNYTEEQLEETFEEIVERWEETSKFVKGKTTREDIDIFIKSQVGSKNTFFLLGMESAAKKIDEAIDKKVDDDFFERNNYTYQIIRQEKGGNDCLEAIIWPET